VKVRAFGAASSSEKRSPGGRHSGGRGGGRRLRLPYLPRIEISSAPPHVRTMMEVDPVLLQQAEAKRGGGHGAQGGADPRVEEVPGGVAPHLGGHACNEVPVAERRQARGTASTTEQEGRQATSPSPPDLLPPLLVGRGVELESTEQGGGSRHSSSMHMKTLGVGAGVVAHRLM
jgi:hypothetical protein